MLKYLIRFLKDKRLESVDYNSDYLTLLHRNILFSKPLMLYVFNTFHKLVYRYSRLYLKIKGIELELGSGVYPIKNNFPLVLASDIKYTQYNDLRVDAHNMPFLDNSVSVVYGINCFHHFHSPDLFFKELERVLHVGGGCILIEPYHGYLASRFYSKSFDTEHFDKNQIGWSVSDSGVMTGANQALSYIVFERDLDKFLNEHPQLELLKIERLNNYLSYVASGGLNFKQLCPYSFRYFLKFMEFLLIPINKFIALHQLIIIRKKR